MVSGGIVMKEWMRTPQVLLQELTQAEKRPKPRYDKLERADDRGVRFRVVLQDAKRPGTDKDLLFTMGRAHGCASDDEARHTVALLALHALGPTVPHERKLPEPYRSLWLTLTGEQKPAPGVPPAQLERAAAPAPAAGGGGGSGGAAGGATSGVSPAAPKTAPAAAASTTSPPPLAAAVPPPPPAAGPPAKLLQVSLATAGSAAEQRAARLEKEARRRERHNKREAALRERLRNSGAEGRLMMMNAFSRALVEAALFPERGGGRVEEEGGSDEEWGLPRVGSAGEGGEGDGGAVCSEGEEEEGGGAYEGAVDPALSLAALRLDGGLQDAVERALRSLGFSAGQAARGCAAGAREAAREAATQAAAAGRAASPPVLAAALSEAPVVAAALDWLCLHEREDALPRAFDPREKVWEMHNVARSAGLAVDADGGAAAAAAAAAPQQQPLLRAGRHVRLLPLESGGERGSAGAGSAESGIAAAAAALETFGVRGCDARSAATAAAAAAGSEGSSFFLAGALLAAACAAKLDAATGAAARAPAAPDASVLAAEEADAAPHLFVGDGEAVEMSDERMGAGEAGAALFATAGSRGAPPHREPRPPLELVWRCVRVTLLLPAALANPRSPAVLNFVYAALPRGCAPPPSLPAEALYPNAPPQLWVHAPALPPAARLNLALHLLARWAAAKRAAATRSEPPAPYLFDAAGWLARDATPAHAALPPAPRAPRSSRPARGPRPPLPAGGAGGGGGGRGARRGAPATHTGAASGPPFFSASTLAAMDRESEALRVAAAARAGDAALARATAARGALPVAPFRGAVLSALANSQVVLLSGGTGCGKTTQVPQFILEDAVAGGRGGRTRIVCTQPRRIAATGVAARVAAERCEPLGVPGGAVGYAIRGERRAHAGTLLSFVTTGVLLRRLTHGLGHVTHIIVDEVHERNVDTDFLLAVLKRVLPRRPDVRVLLMSATMNEASFAAYFRGVGGGGDAGDVPVIAVPGFVHPVKEVYLPDVLRMTGYVPDVKERRAPEGGGGGRGGDFVDALDLRGWSQRPLDYALVAATVVAVVERGGERDDGAILVFMPGVAEIRRLAREVERRAAGCAAAGRMHVLQLHGSLAPGEQALVFTRPPPGKRKVILSTNVAETSVTIDDVTVVVDTFRVKEARYDAAGGLGKLVETWTSAAASAQRRGRAGRTRPGTCYRLIPEAMLASLAPHTTPEIQRSPLEELVLQLLALRLGGGVAEFMGSLLDPPPPAALRAALAALAQIGAVAPTPGGGGVELTALGVHLAALALPPHLGKMLIYGALLRCVDPVLSVVAALADRPPFRAPPPGGCEEGAREAAARAHAAFEWARSDHLAAARAFAAWRAAGGASARRAFADAHALSHDTLRAMEDARREYAALLVDMGFLRCGRRGRDAGEEEGAGEGDAGGRYGELAPSANACAEDTNVVRAALAAGLYPRLVKIVAPPRRYNETISGAMRAARDASELKFYTLHPSHDEEGVSRMLSVAARVARVGGGGGGGGKPAKARAPEASDSDSDDSDDEDREWEEDEQRDEAKALEFSTAEKGKGGGALDTRAKLWRGFLEDRVHLHPGSFNFKVGEYTSPYLVYHEKAATSRVRKF